MATMALLEFPPPQDALRNPEKWNSDWEALLRRELAFPSLPRLLFQRKMMEITMIPMGLQATLASYPSWVSNTCATQRNITEEALRHFSRFDLETRWMDAGPDVRGKHILDAMVSLCSKARNLNEARSYCPELSLKRLRADGKVFLDLLKSVMLEDASFIPTEPKFVSYPGWDAWAADQDKLNDSELKKMSLAEILILRTKLISYVVQFALRSCFGLLPPSFMVQKEHKSGQKANAPTLPPVLTELLGGSEAAKPRFKDEKAAMKARHSQRPGQCCYLGCSKTEPPDGSVKFLRCKPCFDKMQRQVLTAQERARLQTGNFVTKLYYAVRP
ncbi:MYND-type domain-containing protein [Mycena sanguinolenta]|uniref:MYND-type domain-containing protein n=1 Tax=Mycena sanguinolenta TaxID=230812 RepID=A0A8H6ZGG2_9AGAR|nr:MYND-type domain-containing protein [Mycena sanguinolenta]